MRRGKLICLLGVDGSGKTTLTTMLKSRLEADSREVTYLWCGWRAFESAPARLAKRLLRRSEDLGRPATVGRRATRIVYPAAIIDYVLSKLLEVRRAKRRAHFVVCDRYVYDVSAAFAAAAGHSNAGGYTWFYRLFPTPDHLFYIDVPPEIAMARKSDVPDVSYLQALQREYARVLPKELVHVLDGTRPAPELLDEIYKRVTS